MAQDINFQRTGKYVFRVSFNFSHDATNSDIVSNLTLDGVPLSSITTGEILRLESKDSTGNDGDGRGTSQRANFTCNIL